jgi:hypothetical protein
LRIIARNYVLASLTGLNGRTLRRGHGGTPGSNTAHSCIIAFKQLIMTDKILIVFASPKPEEHQELKYQNSNTACDRVLASWFLLLPLETPKSMITHHGQEQEQEAKQDRKAGLRTAAGSCRVTRCGLLGRQRDRIYTGFSNDDERRFLR